ncbi:MAG: zinc dependent phospholipase C family protein [Cytophagaceae bacterium]|nr:zinc dependent phospholipase C family protein [Cytophagaceae bacterium]MDW8457106.1 zinc dependent phospholipase C family protein [Cytophagaceae bacterium]
MAVLLSAIEAMCWGFYAHKQINRLAVFTLPPEMMIFYKRHLDFITHNAVNPDKRRSVLKEEACRHYIDLDIYADSIKLPKYWKEAVARFGEDSLMKHGIVPWHIQRIKHELTEAFRQKSADRILRLSADIGHYIADANVPLHTTKNYNGQLTGQHGIHGLWESRLPELFFQEYDFFVGKAEYIKDTQQSAWDAVLAANKAKDSVLVFEKELTANFPEDRKYSYEERGDITVRVYSREFCHMYHQMLNAQVERRMRAAVHMVGSFWYTCWVDAGQPDLSALCQFEFSEEEKKELEEEKKNTTHRDNCEVH